MTSPQRLYPINLCCWTWQVQGLYPEVILKKVLEWHPWKLSLFFMLSPFSTRTSSLLQRGRVIVLLYKQAYTEYWRIHYLETKALAFLSNLCMSFLSKLCTANLHFALLTFSHKRFYSHTEMLGCAGDYFNWYSQYLCKIPNPLISPSFLLVIIKNWEVGNPSYFLHTSSHILANKSHFGLLPFCFPLLAKS